MSLPFDTPTEFKIHRAELKKELPAKGDMPAKAIVKLGVSVNDEKGWVEMFCDQAPSSWPKVDSTETLILTKPDNPEWAPSARRPGRGGGGGSRGMSPAERARVERMAAHKVAAVVLGPLGDGSLDDYFHTFKEITDWLVKDLP